MKLNKDVIKGLIETSLEKEGYNLLDLEQVLVKEAKSPLELAATPAKTLAMILGAAGFGAGAVAGKEGYRIFDKYQDSEDKIQKSRDHYYAIMNANKELEAELKHRQKQQQ